MLACMQAVNLGFAKTFLISEIGFLYGEQYAAHLTNIKEASTVHCSAVKHSGSGRARKKCREKHETKSSVFPSSRVLYRSLRTLQQTN